MKKFITRNAKEMRKIAQKTVKSVFARTGKKNAAIIALYGDLGSGKTTFTQYLARELGVTETTPSPTFIIERIYKINTKGFAHLIHIDAYRLEREDELLSLGFEEMVSNPENLIVIEWAEKVENVLPKNTLKINFEFVDENTRKIIIMNPRAPKQSLVRGK